MKKETQVTRFESDPRKKKEPDLGDTSATGGFQSPGRDRRSVFDRIAEEKSAVPDFNLTPLNTNRSHIFAIMEHNHLGWAPSRMTEEGKRGIPTSTTAITGTSDTKARIIMT